VCAFVWCGAVECEFQACGCEVSDQVLCVVGTHVRSWENHSPLHETVQWWVYAINSGLEDTAHDPCIDAAATVTDVTFVE
jgi:hypothetical protein